MKVNVTIDDIKRSAKLLDYGNNEYSKQITDDEISFYLIDIKSQIESWISNLKLSFKENDISYYYIKRYIILETIVALAFSNYTENNKGYIESLKLERDKYQNLIEKNTKRFVGQIKPQEVPKLRDGFLFK